MTNPALAPVPSSELATLPTSSESEDWRYDPQKINLYCRSRPWQILSRFIVIAFSFLSFGLSLWWDKLWGQSNAKQKQQAVALRKLLTKLGPTYIKIGQALSTRPDLVSPLYLQELTTLQDQLPSFANEIAYSFIEQELGAPPREIYAELSPEPIAAASLGQVYKGKLKTGETVAVKVQRPDLMKRITLDIFIMRAIAAWAKQNIQRVRSDLIGITDELAARIFEEMNYEQEGRNAEKFAQLYDYMPEIYVPRIYWQYTGRRVLTMEWIDGIKLTNIQEVQAQGIDATHIVEIGVECSLRQLLEHGFFHADPHPGNLLARQNGTLAYLDFGMMSNIQPYQRYGLIQAVVHLVNRDFESLAQDYVKLEFLKEDTDLTPIIPALQKVFANALGASVAELNFKSITDQMSAMMYQFPFRVPAYYALIIRSMVTLEGIAIGIDPNFKVLSKAYPYVAKRLLTDPSQELRSSFQDLLFKDGTFRWNRLENLLRNARNSQDYNLEKVANQALDFLFSERGAFIREKLAGEIIQAIDLFGYKTFFDLTSKVREQLGLEPEATPSELRGHADSGEHLQNIWQIIQATPGFDPVTLLPLLGQLLSKQETMAMGNQILEGLVEKVAVRLIRNILLAQEEVLENGSRNRAVQWKKEQLSLPSKTD